MYANISRSRYVAVNPPNSAQLGDIPYHSSKLHPGRCNSVGMRPQTERQTDTDARKGQTPLRYLLRSWFKAGRRQVPTSFEPVCDQLQTCFEPVSNQIAQWNLALTTIHFA